MVILEIPPARHMPVAFKRERHIRVGSYLKPLREFPEKERRLWELISESHFEMDLCLEGIPGEDLLSSVLDYPACFQRTGQPLPAGTAGIMERLSAEKLIAPRGGGRFDVTNLAAILFARDLDSVPRLGRKALRIILYRGTNRVETIREWKGAQGYAAAYEAGIDWIQNQLPLNEEIRNAFRREEKTYKPRGQSTHIRSTNCNWEGFQGPERRLQAKTKSYGCSNNGLEGLQSPL